ncbi:hypothetical protein PW52_06225 [Tamlana sedimentorum]|uniref:DUF3822 domain-containing protein n=1 Tax=Neotamlana sedimentorum TaxID=1435349 RepID=A0A0D7WAU5_9FLAO|nr:DUF3822 family protein [Tamlana sedimentorum]KJD36194.1 hypothetical protein PW52_06225 [Tamlana sedimentorum]
MALQNKKITKLTNTELSIQISLSGLSFCILNRDTNTVTFLKDITFAKKQNPFGVLDALKNEFNTEAALNGSFSGVSVIHDNELSALVPKPLFNEDYLADYLKFNTKILKSDFITFDDIDVNDSVSVYVPYININNFIYDKFGKFTYKHISTILIESILKTDVNYLVPKAYVNVSKDHFEIAIVQNKKLQLYNSFFYNTKEDFIYYILFCLEQLQLSPETVNLIFLGEIDAYDDLYVIAYKYIRLIFFGDREDAYRYAIDAQPKHKHSNYSIISSF